MSNVIKYPFVDIRGKEAVIIDNNNNDSFVPLFHKQDMNAAPGVDSDVMQFKTISQIEAEKVLAGSNPEKPDGDSGFKSGLPVTDLNELIQERHREAEDKADRLIADAKEKAAKITRDAEIAADAARTSGYEEGKNQGYEDGMAAAEQDIRQKEAELVESARMQREEYASCLAAIEGRYVDIVISLVRKLTGVVMEDKEDLILYLIRMTAEELEPSKNYRIRVSSEDIYFVESHRTELADFIGDEVSLEFMEEKGLEKGQCIIETDSQMVDCGFQTQLDMLIRDLKMLVN